MPRHPAARRADPSRWSLERQGRDARRQQPGEAAGLPGTAQGLSSSRRIGLRLARKNEDRARPVGVEPSVRVLRSWPRWSPPVRPGWTTVPMQRTSPVSSRHRPREVRLQLERRPRRSGFERRHERAAHRRVEQRARESRVDDPDRVVVELGGLALEDRAPVIDLDESEVERLSRLAAGAARRTTIICITSRPEAPRQLARNARSGRPTSTCACGRRPQARR